MFNSVSMKLSDPNAKQLASREFIMFAEKAKGAPLRVVYHKNQEIIRPRTLCETIREKFNRAAAQKAKNAVFEKLQNVLASEQDKRLLDNFKDSESRCRNIRFNREVVGELRGQRYERRAEAF